LVIFLKEVAKFIRVLFVGTPCSKLRQLKIMSNVGLTMALVSMLMISVIAVVSYNSNIQTAYAQARLPNNSVRSATIVDGEVQTADLATGAVTTAKIADDAVTSEKIENGEVTSDDIADGTITSTDIAPGTIPSDSGSGGTPDDNSVTSAKISDGEVKSADIGDGEVAAQDLANGAVTQDKIASGAVALKQSVATSRTIIFPNSQADPRATCPDGTILTGGGFQTVQSGVNVFYSVGEGNVWTVRAFNSNNHEAGLIAYAYCVSLIP